MCGHLHYKMVAVRVCTSRPLPTVHGPPGVLAQLLNCSVKFFFHNCLGGIQSFALFYFGIVQCINNIKNLFFTETPGVNKEKDLPVP